MSQETAPMNHRRKIEPYWYVIAVVIAIGIALFVYHQITGNTPGRVALSISSLNFDIYWYGIIIVFGIALGTYVIARLAEERALWIFNQYVPQGVQDDSISILDLPQDIADDFEARKVYNLGQFLFEWGLNPQRLGLNKGSETIVRDQLVQTPGIDTLWIDDAPWRQWNPDYVWGGVFWCLLFGIIGARLYHIFTPSPSMAQIGINSVTDYLRNPMQLINLRNGGLGIYGAIAGGALGIIVYTRRNRLSAIEWADLAVVGLSLGQAIGRWANFFNQELYGRPTDLPWGITIEHPLPGYGDFSTFHPTFLYVSIWSLITFITLLWLARNKRETLLKGDLMAIYLIMFSLGRIVMELFRLDSRVFQIFGFDTGMPVATVVSLLIVISMVAWLIWRHTGIRRKKE
jgi:phosphatidylglycerol:prolipoprotein diacylglycerol transferase